MIRICLLAAILVLAPLGPSTLSLAHEDQKRSDGHAQQKDDDTRHGAKHGGQLVETADHHGVEMVMSGTSLVFHMTEDHDPLDVTGSNFKAVIQTDTGTRMIELKAEGTTLTATLDAPLPKGAKIALTGKDPHGEVIQARFVIE
ncbi:MAG: hypothetical protein AB7E80_03965 [Hyphomicrobiaceae bacterium]